MMKYGKKIVAVAAIALAVLALAPAAMAAEEEAKDDGGPRLGLFAGLMTGIALHDDTDQWSWSMNAWFRPSQWGAIQMGYSDLGDDLNGFHAAIIPMVPLGVAGLSLMTPIGVLIETGNDGERDQIFTYGGGVIWDGLKIGKVEGLGLRGEYQRYDNGGNQIDNFLFGFFYRFGHQGDK